MLQKLSFVPFAAGGKLCSGARRLPHAGISQVYGGGGNAGATYKNDFIEIFRGTRVSMSAPGACNMRRRARPGSDEANRNDRSRPLLFG
jgi:hypothetical protein